VAVLVAGSIPGVLLGATAMSRVPAPQLRLTFAIFIAATSVRMILS
jgi:uncharacterized membrane protein YfcA